MVNSQQEKIVNTSETERLKLNPINVMNIYLMIIANN